jgi:formiminotetrahydrofolate cyclodeaminase
LSRSFRDLSIDEYLRRLGSGSPTPGGGAAAALTSAQGAALIMMVANHTIGKPKYAEFEELNKDILSEAEVLLGSLTDGIDNDAEAFGKVSEAYALPRSFSDIQIDRVSAEIKRLRAEGHTIDDIDEDGMTVEIMDQIEEALREDRQAAISSVSVLAAEAPLMVMEDSLAALRLAATLKGRSNRMLESDIYVAARCLDAGIRSASYNVEANLPAIAKADPALASEMRQHAAEIISAAADIISDLSSKK